MASIPRCRKCQRGMRQIGRYSEWTCECCDENKRKCPHVKGFRKLLRAIADWA